MISLVAGKRQALRQRLVNVHGSRLQTNCIKMNVLGGFRPRV